MFYHLLLLYLLALIAVTEETDNTIPGATSANARSTLSEMEIIGMTSLQGNGSRLIYSLTLLLPVVVESDQHSVSYNARFAPILWGPLGAR